MNPLEFLAEIVTFFGPPKADHDRSIVGEAPVEEELKRFWRRLGMTLAGAAAAAAFCVWVRALA